MISTYFNCIQWYIHECNTCVHISFHIMYSPSLELFTRPSGKPLKKYPGPAAVLQSGHYWSLTRCSWWPASMIKTVSRFCVGTSVRFLVMLYVNVYIYWRILFISIVKISKIIIIFSMAARSPWFRLIINVDHATKSQNKSASNR